MFIFSTLALVVTFRTLLLAFAPVFPVGAVPFPSPDQADVPKTAVTSTYWLSSIQRQGTVAFGDPSFKVFRNVRDFGAVGRSNFAVVLGLVAINIPSSGCIAFIQSLHRCTLEALTNNA